MGAMNNFHIDTEAARVTTELFDVMAKNGELREQNKRLRELLVMAEAYVIMVNVAIGNDPDKSAIVQALRASNDE